MDTHERIARGLLDPVAALEEKDAEIERLRAENEWLRAGIFWRGVEVTRVENIAIVTAPDFTIWLLNKEHPAALRVEVSDGR